MLSVILQAVSTGRSVDIKKYKEQCARLCIFLLTNFPRVTNKHLPWISITPSPSLHKFLAQSWEIVESNEGKGLKRLDKSGLEANNKMLRHL